MFLVFLFLLLLLLLLPLPLLILILLPLLVLLHFHKSNQMVGEDVFQWTQSCIFKSFPWHKSLPLTQERGEVFDFLLIQLQEVLEASALTFST